MSSSFASPLKMTRTLRTGPDDDIVGGSLASYWSLIPVLLAAREGKIIPDAKPAPFLGER